MGYTSKKKLCLDSRKFPQQHTKLVKINEFKLWTKIKTWLMYIKEFGNQIDTFLKEKKKKHMIPKWEPWE